MSKLHIFESSILDGPISCDKKFYDKSLTNQDIKQDLLERRLKLGRKHGFDGKRIVIPFQKNSHCNEQYKNGKYILINEKIITGYEDLWNLNIPADILLLPKTITGLVIAYPVADCPVLIAEDVKNQVAGLAHCGSEYINRELPIDLIKALQEEVGSKTDDINVHISACASSQNYIYDTYPSWASNKKVWHNFITKETDGYHINLRGSIVNLLQKYNLNKTHINISQNDTISNPMYYSNSAAHFGNQNKNGRFLVGCFYKEDDYPKSKVYKLK